MLSLLAMVAVADTPAPFKQTALCEGVAQIEAATLDKPRAFKSLVVTEMRPTRVRNRDNTFTIQNQPVYVVKPLGGLVDCLFVYNFAISLACYGPTIADDGDEAEISKTLTDFADQVATCLKNDKLTRRVEDFGTAPAISFSGGATEPFYQISMVVLPDVSDKRRPELLVLGPAESPAAPDAKSSGPKAKKATPKSKRR